jgi:cation transport regulator ChaC
MGWNVYDYPSAPHEHGATAADESVEPKPAGCQCEWDGYGSYFWNPDCPEHDEPEDACDEEWQRWFWPYRASLERKAYRKGLRIGELFRGIHQLERIIDARFSDARWNRIDGDESRRSYEVLYRLRSEIEAEIIQIAQEI